MGILVLLKSMQTNGQQFNGKQEELFNSFDKSGVIRKEPYRFVDVGERKLQFNNNYRIITNSNAPVIPKFYKHLPAKVPVINKNIVYRKVNPVFVNHNLKLSGSSPSSSRAAIFPVLPLEKDTGSVSQYYTAIDSYGNPIQHPYGKAPFVPVNNQENINNNNLIQNLDAHNYEYNNNHLDQPCKNSAPLTTNNFPSPNFYSLPGGVFTDLTEIDEVIDPVSLNQQHDVNIFDGIEPTAPDKFTHNELINENTGLSDENNWKPITKTQEFKIYNPKKRKKRSYEVMENVEEDNLPFIIYNYNAYQKRNKIKLKTMQNSKKDKII